MTKQNKQVDKNMLLKNKIHVVKKELKNNEWV